MLRFNLSILLLVLTFGLISFAQERTDKIEKEATDGQLDVATKPPDKQCELVSKPEQIRLPLHVERTSNGGIAAWTVDLNLNGHDTRVLVDTGATGLLVSKSAAERAGLTAATYAEYKGLGDKRPLRGYRVFADRIKLGGLEFKDCMVGIADAKNNRGDGLIGTDMFSDFLVILDFPGKQIRLSSLPKRREELQLPFKTAEGEPAKDPNHENNRLSGESTGDKRYPLPEMQSWTPIHRIGHLLLIPTSINNGPPKLFVIDTGAAQSSISSQAARGVVDMHPDRSSFLYGLNGSIEKFSWGGKVKLSFARFDQNKRQVLVFDASKVSKDIGTEIAGFLGVDTLGQMVLSIDYRDSLVDFQYDPERLGSEWRK